MAGKQAKIVSDVDVRRLLRLIRKSRYPERDRVMVLLSIKAGLRACEIAGLTWAMVLDARGRVGQVIEARDGIAKRGKGRLVPLNRELRQALRRLQAIVPAAPDDAVILAERGTALRASSVVNWFSTLYRRAGLDGCSSHSGRRTFITRAARMIYRVGGSLRDVQQLAGHASIEMTQRY